MNEEKQPTNKEEGVGHKVGSQASLSAFWSELRRRKVVRVAVTYAVVAWLIIQVAVSTFPSLYIPGWALSFVIMCVILGFPVALVLAWAFELTPEGIKSTKATRNEVADTEVSASHAKRRKWFSLLFAAAVPTLIFGTLALFFYIRSGGDSDPAMGEKSIAVLPLENMSPDPENAFFADGVQEDILTNLSKIGDIDKVISRSSTLRYRGSDRNLKQIGEELGVRYLLEGSVRRDANQVRITVQLIEVLTDGHLWAENYDRPLDDTFAIQTEVAKEIARQLKAILSPEEVAKMEYRSTENQEAYDSYLRYNHLVATNPGQSEERMALLDQAVTLDPEFAEAWAKMSMAAILMWDRSHRNDPDLYAKAHHALSEARRLKPERADIFYAEGIFKEVEHNDREGAIVSLLNALEGDPSFTAPRSVLGRWYAGMGRLAESEFIHEELWRIDPLGTWANRNLFHTYSLRKNWEKARSLIQHNLVRGSELNEIWRFRKAILEFIQFGNLQAFASAVQAATGFDEVEAKRMKIRAALYHRDLEVALQENEEVNATLSNGSPLTRARYIPQSGFSQIPYFGESITIEPTQLLSALIWFELNERDRSLKEAENAKSHLESVIETNPNATPIYYSYLALSYALEGKLEATKSIIQQTRERTQKSPEQFRFQVQCETHIAVCYLILGETDKAIETLEAASKMDGPVFLNRELDLWFVFDRLRGNPRFHALLE